MKILHVIASADPRGGGPIEGIRQRGVALLAMGHQPEVLTLDAPDASFLRDFPLPVHAVGPALGTYGWAPAIKPWLRSHAREYDAVIISGLWQYHAWATSRVLRHMGVKYWVFTHGMLDPWFREHYPFKHLKKLTYWHLAERHVLSHAQAVLFTSEEERLRARESFGGHAVTERVVDYGTNPPPCNGPAFRHAFRGLHPALAQKTLLLFLGRVHEKKGCDLLVQAFAQVAAAHPQVHLVMAGPAESLLQSRLQDQATALGVGDRITWLGMLQGDAKWQALYGCDVFVLPSHQENFGIAVVEALGCGLPVLVSDKVNTWREMVADGAAYVEPDTAQGTTDLLRRWLATPSSARAAMAAQASQTFTQRYTAEGAARSLLLELQQSVHTVDVQPGRLMKILHVVSSVNPALGGVAESIRSRGVKLVEMGHTVEVVSMDETSAPFIAGYELKLHALGRGFSAWQYHPRLAGWLRANCQRFDAVVVDGLWQYHGTATRKALKGTGVPYFVFPHGMLDPWFKRTYPLKHLKKWLFWPWAEYRVLRDAKAALFTCEEERRLAKQSFWLYKASERLAPLGTAEPPGNSGEQGDKFRGKFPTLRGKPFVLFLGRLHPKKGCDLLLHAFAALPPELVKSYQLVMAGPADVTYLATLKAQVETLGISTSVHWLGMIEGDIKWGAVKACEAFALMSHQENFGISVVEALACGKPVLISDKVNIWREIATEEAGLVHPDTVAGAIACFRDWFELTQQARHQMELNSIKIFRRDFTIGASASLFINAINH